MRPFGLMVICFFLLTIICIAEVKEIVVTSEAKINDNNTMTAREEALTDAKSKAITKGLLSFVTQSTIDNNIQIIEDNIFSKVDDLIKKVKILDEDKQKNNTIYFVKIRANLDMDQLSVLVKKLNLLAGVMGNPKILSLIEEVSTSSVTSMVEDESSASIAIEEKLIEHGFDLVDRQQIKKIREEEMTEMGEFLINKIMDDPVAITRLVKKAQDYGAQYLLMGSAQILPGTETDGIFVANAAFKCRVVDASTAEKIATTQASESGRGNNQNGADLVAGQRAGEVAGLEIIPDIIQNWSKREMKGVIFNVKIYGVTSYAKQARKLMKAVKGISGVSSCEQRLWDKKLGRLELEISYKGGGDALVDELFTTAESLPGFENFDLQSQTGNDINFTLQ
jgi:hypothetical protein